MFASVSWWTEVVVFQSCWFTCSLTWHATKMSVAGTTLYPRCGRGQCLLRIVAASVYDVNQRFVLQACNICCCFIDMTDIISMYCAVNLFHDQCCCFSRWFACRCDVFECFWFGIINWSQGCRWRKHVWLLLGTSSQVNTGSCPDIVWDVDWWWQCIFSIMDASYVRQAQKHLIYFDHIDKWWEFTPMIYRSCGWCTCFRLLDVSVQFARPLFCWHSWSFFHIFSLIPQDRGPPARRLENQNPVNPSRTFAARCCLVFATGHTWEIAKMTWRFKNTNRSRYYQEFFLPSCFEYFECYFNLSR